MAHDIFISYAKEDREVAKKVNQALKDAGYKTWIAPDSIQPGKGFAGAIAAAIAEAPVMVLIHSEHSNSSEHILNEVNLAFNTGRATSLIPFRVAEIDYNADLQYYLARTQWVEAWTPPIEAHLQSLVDWVREIHPPAVVDREVPQTDEAPKEHEQTPPPPGTDESADADDGEPTRIGSEPEGKGDDEPLGEAGKGDGRVSAGSGDVRRPGGTVVGTGDGRTLDVRTLKGTGDGRKPLPVMWIAAGAGALLLLIAVVALSLYRPGGGKKTVNENSVNENSAGVASANTSAAAADSNAGVASASTPTPYASANSPAPGPAPQQTPTPTPTPGQTPTPVPTPSRGHTDAQIASELKMKMRGYEGLRSVRYTVRNGTVVLSGRVPTESCAQAAEALSRRINGVVGVVNKISLSIHSSEQEEDECRFPRR